MMNGWTIDAQEASTMARLYILLAIIALSLVPAADGIAQDNACGSASATEVTSLSALPPALRTALAAGSPRGKIADVNEPFSSTDVISDDIPDQRFRSGKLTQDCAAVLVERGAGHYSRITIIFRRIGDFWAESTRIVTPPQWSR
jgi:hypothetical protein